MSKTRILSTKRIEVLHPVFEAALLLFSCSLFEPNRIVTEIQEGKTYKVIVVNEKIEYIIIILAAANIIIRSEMGTF